MKLHKSRLNINNCTIYIKLTPDKKRKKNKQNIKRKCK